MSDASETVNGRKKLEEAVRRVGRSLEALIKVSETEIELKESDINKSFDYIASVIDAARQRAALGHRVGQAAGGGFSLDQSQELPIFSGSISPSESRQQRIVGERIVGDKKKRPPPPIDDDVDFIEE